MQCEGVALNMGVNVMSKFQIAERLVRVPTYLFAEIDRVKNEVKARGVDIINLGIGDPDLPTPKFIVKAMQESVTRTANHQYPSYTGLLSFRTAVADWYRIRFGVVLNPETEVISLIGSKEGIAHFPFAFIDPGDLALVCSPNYPVYNIAISLAGGEVQFVPLTDSYAFLPNLEAIPEEIWVMAKCIFVNYPNNPTAATASRNFYERLIAKALEYNVIVVHDAAYSEIYFNEFNKPCSILEFEGSKDIAIEFHSLSKSYNMTGWRIGMAVGNHALVQGLGKVKENMDSGIFQAVQEAGIVALVQGEPYTRKMRDIYCKRRDLVLDALKKIGIQCRIPEATLYVWAQVPEGAGSSTDFVTCVLQETGVVVTPGNGFGAAGEGYFRISCTVDTARLEEAVSRIVKL
ncbi:LL-diaminopimelate aminotransferase [Desulfovibrionales bacterium]